jgi:hypothetical protein
MTSAAFDNVVKLNGLVTTPNNVKLYGVVGDGVADDTSAMQSAINAAIVGKFSLYVPAGTYRITDTLSFVNADGLMVCGDGSGFLGPTRFVCDADIPTKPLFLFSDCRNIVLRDFSTRCSATKRIKCALQFENGSGSTVTATTYQMENLYLYSTTNATGQTNGVLFALGAGGDNNNDFGKFINVVISNYDNAAVKIEHSQSREHVFYACYFQSGTYAVETDGNSFFWFGGNVSEHSEADFYLLRPQQSTIIDGLSSEQSSRLLTSNASGADGYVSISGVRFAADFLNADGRVIDYRHRGALVLNGNIFGTRTDPNLCKVRVSPIDSKGCAFISQGNTWGGTGSLTAFPYQLSLTRGDKIVIKDNYVAASTLVDVVTTFTAGDTSPSLFASDWWQTANTGATTIIQFDDTWPGKTTTIYFNDANTTIDFTNTTKLRGNNGVAFTGAVGDSMVCVSDGDTHYCSIIQG